MAQLDNTFPDERERQIPPGRWHLPISAESQLRSGIDSVLILGMGRRVAPLVSQPAVSACHRCLHGKGTDPVEALGELIQMGDAPACNICGSLMVRSGTCYRCVTCGNKRMLIAAAQERGSEERGASEMR